MRNMTSTLLADQHRLRTAVRHDRRDPQPEGRYPPYNIVRTGEDTYRVSVALAGFAPPDRRHPAPERADGHGPPVGEGRQRRIPLPGHRRRAFEKRFSLADYVEVEGASFEDGLLHIDLVRRLPEAMKPRRIEVGVKTAPGEGGNLKTIEHEKAA